MPSNVLPLHLKQNFLPKIWIFTEGEGDGIESRLSSLISSTLKKFSTVETISFKLIANPSTIDALIEGASLCVGLLFFNS